MNVALVAPRFPPNYDGVGDHAEHVATGLTGAGHRVLVVTDGSARPPAPYEIRSIGASWSPTAARAALHHIAGWKAEATFLEYTPFLFGPMSVVPTALTLTLRARRVPVGVFAHEAFYPSDSPAVAGRAKAELLAMCDRVVIGNANAVFVADEMHRARIASRCPGATAKVHVIPIGANFEPTPDSRWHPTRGSRRRVVTFGVVMPRRRIELIVGAMRELVELGVDVELAVVGRVYDTAYAARCERVVREAGLADRVRIYGALPAPQVSSMLLSADAVVHATEEGTVASSGALLAALAHGVPIVAAATAFDDPRFFDCVLRVPANTSGIATAIAGLLSGDSAAELGKRAKETYNANFRWQSIVEASLDLLQRERLLLHAASS